MAKLTLHFKNKVIHVFHLTEGNTTIGRDSNNTFSIDSLAIAPTHLIISFENKQFYAESLSEQFPSLINGKPFQKVPLHQGIKISLAKHDLLFTEDSVDYKNLPRTKAPSYDGQSLKSTGLTTANLQVMNGKDIGRLSVLTAALTEIKDDDRVTAIIAKRQSGYFISKLADDIDIHVNGVIANNETKLENNTKIKVNQRQFIFFTE